MAEPYESGVAPTVGGGVRVSVDGWGYWNVWLEVESYVHWKDTADTALQPSESVGIAWRLVVAAAVCWWKRLPDQLRGRLNKPQRGRLAVILLAMLLLVGCERGPVTTPAPSPPVLAPTTPPPAERSR
jgi:hypothetical protein